MGIPCLPCRTSLRASLVLALLALSSLPPTAVGRWDTLGMTDGLATNNVWAILEDSSGNLWFGTDGGTSRYDGLHWQTFEHPSKIVYEDRAGGIWLSDIGGGVFRFDGRDWTHYTEADGLIDDAVQAVLEDASGSMWFGTRRGLSRLDGETWTTYRASDMDMSVGDVRAIHEDAAGLVWFGGLGGVTRFDGTGWSRFPGVSAVTDMVDSRSGDMWFATMAGTYRYDGATITRFRFDGSGQGDDDNTCVTEDSHGGIWVGTMSAGAGRFDGTGWTWYTVEDGLSNDYVRAVVEDSSGLIWFAGVGATYWDRVSWTTEVPLENPYSLHVLALAEGDSGAVWAGTQQGVGVFRDGSWTGYTTADGLLDDRVESILVDASGRVWVGTHGGVSRYNGAVWENLTTVDGLAGDTVYAILEDRIGRLWFGTNRGISRYDGIGWRTYTRADGLVGDLTYCLLMDSSGILWAGSAQGLSRFDGNTWSRVLLDDQPGLHGVSALLEDSSGALWLGTGLGLLRYEGGIWRTYTAADGLSGEVSAILEDRTGALWFGTSDGGVSRLHDGEWGNYGVSPETLPSQNIRDVLEDSSGVLWFATWSGVTRHEPDRVAPRTRILVRPPDVSTSRFQRVDFSVAHGVYPGTRFSYSLDGGPWSPWSSGTSWSAELPGDGSYTLEVRSRDDIGNVDRIPAAARFEIDTRAPVPILSSPVFGQAIRGTVPILGSADDPRFEEYRVSWRPAAPSTGWTLITRSGTPVADGRLAEWHTKSHPDGIYRLQLAVGDTLGLVGISEIEILVDNEAPWAEETSPAHVAGQNGGDVYSLDGEVHLYFPPHAFTEDATVRLEPAAVGTLPDSLPDGARLVGRGFTVGWGASELQKKARLEWSLSPDGIAQGASLFFRDVGMGPGTWERLGGTLDPDTGTLSSGIRHAGSYALFSGGQPTVGREGLGDIVIAPRAFSPGGGFADTRASIGFRLSRPDRVTVKIYNRAGRLVREIGTDMQLQEGENLLYWDGQDQGGATVNDGLYLVVVEALGDRQVKTLAVVR